MNTSIRFWLTFLLCMCTFTLLNVVLEAWGEGDYTQLAALAVLFVGCFLVVPTVVNQAIGKFVTGVLTLVASVVGSPALTRLVPSMLQGPKQGE